MGKIIFNNISSEDLGLVVQTPPSYEFPAKDVESTHIIGRNGDIIIDNGSYKNVTRTYNVAAVFRKGTNFVQNVNRIIEWLYSSKGYARLEDTYEPEYYRKAVYNSGGDNLSNYYNEATVIQISFVCQPQRWLKIGEEEIKIQNGQSVVLSNPTRYVSLPKIDVKIYKTNLLPQSIVDNILPETKKISAPSIYSYKTKPLIINYKYLIDTHRSNVKIKFRHLETNFDTYIILDVDKLRKDLAKSNEVRFRIYDNYYDAASNILVAWDFNDGELVVLDYVWSKKEASTNNTQEGVKLLACYEAGEEKPIGYSSLGTDENGQIPTKERYSYVKNTLNSVIDEEKNNNYITIIGIEDSSVQDVSTIEFQQEHNGKITTYNTITINNDMENLIIDSEISECYNNIGFLNSKVSSTDGFPYLLQGETIIKTTNCDITITPRWWTL